MAYLVVIIKVLFHVACFVLALEARGLTRAVLDV